MTKTLRQCELCHNAVAQAHARYDNRVLCKMCNRDWTFAPDGKVVSRRDKTQVYVPPAEKPRKSKKAHPRSFTIPETPPVILKPPAPLPRHNKPLVVRKCVSCDQNIKRAFLKHYNKIGDIVAVICKNCAQHGFYFDRAGILMHREMTTKVD